MKDYLFLTIQQVADILQVSTRQVSRYINREKDPLPTVMIDTVKRISKQDLNEWINNYLKK